MMADVFAVFLVPSVGITIGLLYGRVVRKRAAALRREVSNRFGPEQLEDRSVRRRIGVRAYLFFVPAGLWHRRQRQWEKAREAIKAQSRGRGRGHGESFDV